MAGEYNRGEIVCGIIYKHLQNLVKTSDPFLCPPSMYLLARPPVSSGVGTNAHRINGLCGHQMSCGDEWLASLLPQDWVTHTPQPPCGFFLVKLEVVLRFSWGFLAATFARLSANWFPPKASWVTRHEWLTRGNNGCQPPSN